MSLGACRLTKRILAVVASLWFSLSFMSCGSSKPKNPPSGLQHRVLAAQASASATTIPGLVIINGLLDVFPRISPISAGGAPHLLAVSPSRNIAAAFDASSNTVFAANTGTEAAIGNVRLPGPATSLVFPSSNSVGYAAVPTAFVNGFSFLGAIEYMNFTTNSLAATIPVTNAQTVISNASVTTPGSLLVVFSNNSDSIAVINPGNVTPPIDNSCLTGFPNDVCTVVSGFDRPVYGIINGNTAYILNCGAECGGVQASVQTLDLTTFAVGTPVPVNGATYAFLNGTKLYVAGNGTPNGPTCASIPNAAKTAATYCGLLDIVDTSTMTDPYYNNPKSEIAIPDGYHDQMDMSINGQLFVGSHDCTNIGNANNPVGEVRGCLAILNTNTGTVVFPPENGDVNGLQSFTSREIEYVAEGGALRVYDTTIDALHINDVYLPTGTINIVGYISGVKAIDFF